MSIATTTKISELTIGAELRAGRESLGLLAEEVALKTKIPAKYLVRLEESLYEDLADDAYTRIYLKAYAKFLGLDAGEAVTRFAAERAAALPPSVEPARHRQVSALSASALSVTPHRIRNAAIAIVLLGMAAYVAFSIERAIAPPRVTLVSPVDGYVTRDKSVDVKGTTVREATLSVNGEAIAPDADGNFHEDLALQDGLNVITITAARSHSKPMTVTRRVIVEPASSGVASATAGPAK